jgi:lysophospholipase L1-like esterase
MPAPASRLPVWKKLGFGLVTLVGLAGLLELGLRMVDPEILRFVHQARQVHRYAGWHKVDLRPSRSALLRLTNDDGTALFDFTLSTGELGTRVETGAIPVLNNDRRKIVHCIGDSLTMGWGVEADDTYPAQLQRLLANEARVINLGVDGFGLLASRHKSQLVAERYAPDVLVYLFWTNDFDDDELTERVQSRSRLEHLGWKLIDELRSVSYVANLPFALKWLLYYAPVRSRPPTLAAEAAPVPENVLRRAATEKAPRNATTRALAELGEWSRQQDVPLLLVVLDDSPESVGILSAALGLGLPGSLFPMTPAMRIPGDGHLSRAGNALLAEHVAGLVREALRR